MSKVISVTSFQHFKSITSGSVYTVVDFYADWCGPCKVISPVFEQLAAAESKPGRIVFCKVNVDSQRDVAGTYGISAYVARHSSNRSAAADLCAPACLPSSSSKALR